MLALASEDLRNEYLEKRTAIEKIKKRLDFLAEKEAEMKKELAEIRANTANIQDQIDEIVALENNTAYTPRREDISPEEFKEKCTIDEFKKTVQCREEDKKINRKNM